MNEIQTLCTTAPWDVLSNNTKIKARYETALRLSVAGQLQEDWKLESIFFNFFFSKRFSNNVTLQHFKIKARLVSPLWIFDIVLRMDIS